MTDEEQTRYNVLLAEKKTLWDNWRKDQSRMRSLRKKVKELQEEVDRLRSDQYELTAIREYDGW